MSTETNAAVVRRWFKEVFEGGNLGVADEIFSATYVSHDPNGPPGGWPHGSEGPKAVAATYRGAFPDIRYTIDDQIAVGDKVVTRWTAEATNTGSLMGMPPSGKHAAVTGMSIERLADGKIVETWVNFDLFGLLQKIGAIPQPEHG